MDRPVGYQKTTPIQKIKTEKTIDKSQRKSYPTSRVTFILGVKMREKFISTNELANDASKILKNLKKDEGTVILRYSEPVGVLISYDDYKRLGSLEESFVKECKSCLVDLKKEKR